MFKTATQFISPPTGLPHTPTRSPSPPPASNPGRPFEVALAGFRSAGMTAGQAVRAAVASYPDLHRDWLRWKNRDNFL